MMGDDKEYSVVLGKTFKEEGSDDVIYHTMRYQFKPASCDKSHPAVVNVNKTTTKQVTVEYRNHDHPEKVVHFSGHYEVANDTECVLIYDGGDRFRLEKLTNNVKALKHERHATDSTFPHYSTRKRAKLDEINETPGDEGSDLEWDDDEPGEAAPSPIDNIPPKLDIQPPPRMEGSNTNNNDATSSDSSSSSSSGSSSSSSSSK